MSGWPEADDAGAETPPADRGVPLLRVAEVVAVDVPLPSQFPLVTIQETEPPFRQLVIPIGMAEGVSLSHALHKVETPRPLTHDLFTTVLQRLSVDVAAVRIVGREHGNYLAEIHLMTPGGADTVPCRPSDALALGMRQPVPAPVLVDPRLFEEGNGDVLPQPTPGAPPD